MHRAVVSLPDGLACAGALARRASSAPRPACGSPTGAPALPLDPAWDLAGAAAMLARTEELGGAVGRARPLPGVGLGARGGRGAARRPRARAARGGDGAGVEPAPDYPARRALRRGADARHRHALALERARPARRRRPAQGRARARRRGRGARRGSRAGARAAAPAARQRPQLVARPLRRARARVAASRSTCFVLAAHRDPHDGAVARGVRRAPRAARGRARPARARGRPARELHLPRRRAACSQSERAELARLLGGPIAGNRHHYLRLPWHEGIRALDRLGFAYDTTLGYAERPGPRAGLSFPFRPWDVAAGAPLRILELPLVLMDATLAEERYLGLSPEAAWEEVERVLDHLHDVRRLREHPLAQRPLRPRLRARLGPALRAAAGRHRRARRPRRHGAAR